MIQNFTKEFMTSNRGCYSREKMLNVKCVKEDNVTLENLFNDLPIKDFCWFFVRKCELTTIQKQRFALHCAKQVLPIFEKNRPDDKRVRECIETIELYLDGKATIEELIVKRAANTAAADAAYVANAAYAAADAANTAAAYAADAAAAANAAYDAAYDAYSAYVAAIAANTTATYAADAAYAANAAYAYKESIWKFVCSQ